MKFCASFSVAPRGRENGASSYFAMLLHSKINGWLQNGSQPFTAVGRNARPYYGLIPDLKFYRMIIPQSVPLCNPPKGSFEKNGGGGKERRRRGRRGCCSPPEGAAARGRAGPLSAVHRRAAMQRRGRHRRVHAKISQETCDSAIDLSRIKCYTILMNRTDVLKQGGERMQNERERLLEEIVRILRGADTGRLRMVWWFVRGME